MENILSLVREERKKNQIKREIEENEKRIRDNRKKIELLNNLKEYITPEMKYKDIIEIIENMKFDYENRLDDYIIKNAELGKIRREINKKMNDFKKSLVKE